MANDHDEGYGKPPKHSQFKPGASGNPKGRPKGGRNLKSDLHDELSEKIKIKEGGQPKTVTKQRAMLKTLTAKAVHGDSKAANVIMGMVFKLFHDDHDQGEESALTKTDEAILKEFEAAILKAKEKKNG